MYMTTPDKLPYTEPSNMAIDFICKWLLDNVVKQDYDIDEALQDAHVVAYMDAAMTAGWIIEPGTLRLHGLTMKDGVAHLHPD